MTNEEALETKTGDVIAVGELEAVVIEPVSHRTGDVFIKTAFGDFNASVCTAVSKTTEKIITGRDERGEFTQVGALKVYTTTIEAQFLKLLEDSRVFLVRPRGDKDYVLSTGEKDVMWMIPSKFVETNSERFDFNDQVSPKKSRGENYETEPLEINWQDLAAADKDVLEKIGELAERLDSALFMYQNGKMLPPQTHLQGLTGTMFDVRDELIELYKDKGGDEELDIQAEQQG